MGIVFSGLIMLMVILKLFPLLLRIKTEPEQTGKTDTDDGELIAILTAAIYAFEQKRKANPMVRSGGDTYRAVATDIVVTDPMVRDCVHVNQD
ncbi:OadG family protein [Oscillibacter sp. MSJ-2]|uniref:OadG family protein n=2 Tax=Dysosmobacter acutus TaxID=2841504 RepID=A0ABS6FET5_9FIRM|nr:OadG family protein [Dysosmobacter acutus]